MIQAIEPELYIIELRRLDAIFPAPENDDVYQAISVNDPEIIQLARSIREIGIQEPLLISLDHYIVSGHRRHVAARLAKLVLVPVRVFPISRRNNRKEFLKLLVEMNSQRIKSTNVLVRESLIKIDPKAAHRQIMNERIQKDALRSGANLSLIDPAQDGRRCEISQAKAPFLEAVQRVLDAYERYWPLSDRQVHYRLLGARAPLTHAGKRDSRYRNDKGSYRKLVDLVARGRVAGRIPWQAIEDETRPIDLHAAFWNPAQFFRQELRAFLSGYWRNRQQSQPHHIEIVAEKLTVRSILQQVAQRYTIPLTISRGMSSLPPKKAIHDRFRRSRKDTLILLVVSDLDPAGDAIAADLVKSFRRDFGIHDIEAYKVALTFSQVQDFALSPSMEAKDTSPTYAAFVERYGITDAYELEALAPDDLAGTLKAAIDKVMDLDAYNAELATEEADSAQIVAVRQQVETFLQTLNLTNDHQ